MGSAVNRLLEYNKLSQRERRMFINNQAPAAEVVDSFDYTYGPNYRGWHGFATIVKVKKNGTLWRFDQRISDKTGEIVYEPPYRIEKVQDGAWKDRYILAGVVLRIKPKKPKSKLSKKDKLKRKKLREELKAKMEKEKAKAEAEANEA